ncbi:cobyrinate a,c-diamide synthase [Aureimonas jatrophae]|uniref:Hydrogenobyrinate a,c-diamide synthase n=1 Tax=Aureimonas jatrophae TaxID=1166073 RepID=A0A1H0D8F7_9HYPH|nr:cobyrinate a,c-diamide synthase [Aureimonas jatrophae]MBB3951755.1 cobyrinic acid a,c-diamide synthase [Aureimonas jatrophae]SDN66395.1 hydrogenobyrinic acid a,c-diamide synthase (glutamine-hydrolysing) /cobyrinate a,c-diamide synthase [Aureimonas jatrophae]
MPSPPSPSGLLVAAPHSGSGKTLVTLALLAHLRREGIAVQPAKAGPDYIDPAFHAAAAGVPSVNLDPYAMRPALIRALVQGPAPLVAEGMMGLFDGAADGSGSSADLAELLDLAVVLVVDCGRQSQSVAALVRGFRDHRPRLRFAGLVLNRVASPRHERMLRTALEPLGLPVLAALPPAPHLVLPERHLGLVQAGEHAGLSAFLGDAADWFAAGLVPGALDAWLAAHVSRETARPETLAPLGTRIAVASDTAFAFSYPHLLDGWRAAGATLHPFSPLADEAPDPSADAVFLPGGYPELHAGRLAANAVFRDGMHRAAAGGARIYGECGGYMVLGEGLVDAAGARHAMLGLLRLETSFAERRRHLGYRRLEAQPGGPWDGALTAHEFHYTSTLSERGEPLFRARDALGDDLGFSGLRAGRVAGSFLHVIDRA